MKNECNMRDTTVLRNLIIENPDLPLIVFCGENTWGGDTGYTQASITMCEIEYVTLFGDTWYEKDGLREYLNDVLAYEEEYENLSDEEYGEMIEDKVKNAEFIKAIVLWVN